MKKIIAIILSLIILILSAVPVFAQTDGSNNNLESVQEFKDYVLNVAYKYAIIGREPGNLHPIYAKEPFNTLRDDVEYMLEQCQKCEDGEITLSDEELASMRAKLDEDASKVFIGRGELEYMIKILSDESNRGGYFDDEFWEYIQSVLTKAKNAYEGYESDEEVENIYWETRYVFNELCAYNQVPGDVDGNGVVDISDATLIQMFLAKIITFNSSQLTVANVSNERVETISSNEYAYIDINDVTALQLYLAYITDSISSDFLDKVTENISSRDTDDNDVYSYLIYCKYFH